MEPRVSERTVRHERGPWEWTRIGYSTGEDFCAGHRWMYGDTILRRAWKVGPVGIYVLRLRRVTS